MEKYTGRKIAVLSDIHSLYEPTKAVLDDIKSRGITEIYSLGDNFGLGPNPKEVYDLLLERGVKSTAGNHEYYITLGSEPFKSYFHHLKEMSLTWTLSKLGEKEIGVISLYPSFIELMVGGKKIALCHFANDVRIDFLERSTWTYQASLDSGYPGYHQFDYTNSKIQMEEIEHMIQKYGVDSPYVRGYLSSKKDPIFAKRTINYFDAIVQGHVHFKFYEKSDSTEFYTIRAVGIGYQKDPIDTASYVIINETTTGYEIEEILVKYDREKMVYSVLNCTNPDVSIRRMANIFEDEKKVIL